MANTTQEFIDALKEADKVAFIDSLIAKHAGSMTAAEKTTLGHILATKDANLDIMADNIQVAFNRISALGLDASGSTLVSTDEIELLHTQVLPTDPAVIGGSKTLITVGNVFKAIKDFGATLPALYEATLGKPTKDDQILSSKKDGTRSWIDAPSGGAGVAPADQAKLDHITVTKDVDLDQMATLDDVSSAGGLFQFDYKIEVGTVDATPAAKKLAFDNADPKLATKIYINKTDRTNTDMSLFLKSLKAGDYLNLHDNNNINDFIAYDVSGAAVQTGNIFTIPVTKYDDNGTLTNGERVFVHWNAMVSSPKLDHITVTKDIDLDTVSTVAHLHGTTVPADTLGKDGDTYFKIA